MRGHVPANLLQKNFYRAGHAHAAVLLVLGFAILSVIDYTPLDGILAFIGRSFVPIAAILMLRPGRPAERDHRGRAGPRVRDDGAQR